MKIVFLGYLVPISLVVKQLVATQKKMVSEQINLPTPWSSYTIININSIMILCHSHSLSLFFFSVTVLWCFRKPRPPTCSVLIFRFHFYTSFKPFQNINRSHSFSLSFPFTLNIPLYYYCFFFNPFSTTYVTYPN